jgi:2-iminobutanoate/2-iminopropanoate deaminase
MSDLRYVNVEAAAAPPEVPFSHAVADGDYAFLAGQIASDAVDGEVRLGDIEDETRVVMELLRTVLGRLGLDFSDVVRVNVYMTDLSQAAPMNAVYQSYFAPGRLPARTCVGVTGVLGTGQIEIDCIARLRA